LLDPVSQSADLEASIRALEAQRAVLGDVVVDTAIAALREKLGASAASGERKLVTIVFGDISGFTKMSATRDPEEVRDLTTAAFDVLVPIIERYGGIVDKFIGDAVMALFGAKIAREDDARSALMAALDMREAFDEFVARTGLELDIHFGVNTGTVVTGQVGASGSGAFSVMGDAVNLASRLEHLSEPGEILVGATTRELVGEAFAFDAREPVPLKGSPEPVPVFALLDRNSGGGSRRLQAPLVGRASEIAALSAALDRVRSREAVAISVIGEAGTGKSRLTAEAQGQAGQGVRWVQVRSLSHDQSIGFGALRALLRAVLDIASDSSEAAHAEAIRSRIERRFAPHERDDAFAELAMVAGIEDGSADRLRGIARDLLYRRLAVTLRRWLEPLPEEQPLAIVWEDLHWADTSSLRLLGRIAPGPLPRGCLQIFCFRPDDALEAAVASSGTACIRLEPLTAEQSQTLIQSLLGEMQLGEEVTSAILARADGNPFFLEEIIQSLLDTITAQKGAGRAPAANDLGANSIPTTLQGVLLARLDQLQLSQKQVLQTASILGRIFELPLLDALLSNERTLREGLPAILESLRSLDLIRTSQARAPEESHYKFKHALTQEVAYHSVLLATRRKLHEAAAELLAASGADSEEAAPLIAFHFERSDAPERAIPYLQVAARSAARIYAPREAVAYYRRIVALAPELADAPDRGAAVLVGAYEAMGELLQVGGRPAQALECLDAARALVPEDAHLARARLLRRTGLAWMGRRTTAEAIDAYQQANAALDRAEDRNEDWWSEWIEVQLDLAWALSWQGDNREAHQVLAAAGERIEQRGTLGQRARYRDRMIIAKLFREAAHPSEGTIASAREALAMAEEWGEPRGIGMACYTLGYGLTFKGELAEACEQLGRSLRIALDIGDGDYEVPARATLGIAQRLAGDLAAVEEGVEKSIACARAVGMSALLGIGLANQAWSLMRHGRGAEARAAATEAAAIWAKEPWLIKWLAHWPLLSVAIDDEDVSAALEHCKTMLAPYQYDMGEDIVAGLREGCEAAERGEPALALAAFGKARELARARGMA
jgi:adenylate cyclase